MGRKILCLFGVCAFLCGTAAAENPCARIVSLAPSVTETIFALGLGKNVVGVSRYCRFPPAVSALPKVGGFLDPNFEAIVALKPTVVMYPEELRERAEEFQKLGLMGKALDQRRISDIEQSITTIGSYCDANEAAHKLRNELQSALDDVRSRTRELKKVRVLVVVGSEEVGTLKSLYVSGRDGFYDELVSAAGGENVVLGETRSATALSLESIVGLNPEVIIEMHPDISDAAAGAKKALAAWQAFPMLSAVQTKRIYVLGADYTYIPGPRFPKLLHMLASILHPEVFSGGDGPA